MKIQAIDGKPLSAGGKLLRVAAGTCDCGPEVFWATYGETTYEEIKAAYEAGQIVHAMKNDASGGTLIGQLISVSQNVSSFLFAVCGPDDAYAIDDISGYKALIEWTINSSGTWSEHTGAEGSDKANAFATANTIASFYNKCLPAYGSYTGDDAGSKTLAFDFEPRLIIIQSEPTGGISTTYTCFCVNPASVGNIMSSSNKTNQFDITWNSKEVTLTNSASHLFNLKGRKYHYVAFPKG